MLKASCAWIIMFAISLIVARGAAWGVAFQMTIPFPTYDEEVIYRRIKGRVFTPFWLLCTIVSSTLVSVAMLSDEVLAIALILSGVGLIVTCSFVRGFELFKLALAELDLPWPPQHDD